MHMPAAARLGDKSKVDSDSHGCPACPHTATGPAIAGSPDVLINKMPAIRVDDKGVHSPCCGGGTWIAKTGSATVLINGKKAHRKDDQDQHCGGMGKMIEGSSDVNIGG